MAPLPPAAHLDLHEPLAQRFFAEAMQLGVLVGQIRTRLGIAGRERRGPQEAAEALFRFLVEDARRGP